MYSCDHERTAFGAKYQPCIGVASGRPDHHAVGTKPQPAAGQAPAAGSAAAQPQRAAKKRRTAAAPRPSTSLRRSSTTMVATDVSNFRAMVQELTGFRTAAIFRPLPRRIPFHAVNQFAQVNGCSGGIGGGALHGRSSDTTTAAGSSSSPNVPTVQLLQCSSAGVFDGLPDLGSPEFDSWPEFSVE